MQTENWTVEVDNKVSNQDKNTSFIVKSWSNDVVEETVTVFHEPDFPDNPYHVEIQGFGTYAEYSSSVDAKEDAVRLMRENPKGINTEESSSIPEDVKVTFTTGQPVKAHKYYDPEWSENHKEDFKPWDKDKPLYGNGRNKRTKVAHSGDLRDVQAHSSTVMFIYSDEGQLDWDQLLEVVEPVDGIISTNHSIQKIYFWNGMRPIPALKTSTENTHRRLMPEMVREYEDSQFEPQFSPEDVEISIETMKGTFWIFT